MSHQILLITPGGYPMRWVGVERAVYYIFKGLVVWTPTDVSYVVRGGINAASQQQSKLQIPSIMAIRGLEHNPQLPRKRKSARALFARDGHKCAYCGGQFSNMALTQDHVIPQAQGGNDDWVNLVSACFPCNNRKGNRTPDEVGMPLLYKPYTPTRAQYLNFIQPVKLSCQEQWIESYT